MVSYEICRGEQTLEIRTLKPDEDIHEFIADNIRRSFELKGLVFSTQLTFIGNKHRESIYQLFDCKESEESEGLLITTPIGVARLKAKRVRAGGLLPYYQNGAAGLVAVTRGQVSLPIKINGRLIPPKGSIKTWAFQPSQIKYADGTSSGYLGDYPKDIDWVEPPVW